MSSIMLTQIVMTEKKKNLEFPSSESAGIFHQIQILYV